MKYTRKKLIQEFLNFFKSKSHSIIPNASLIPEHDPTVLFTTAGMHPLTPYLLGQPHPQGKRLANIQRCIRTTDIEEVGDAFHHTFFEMLGNWSLGDYWKKSAIEYSFEFLTKQLGIKKEKLAVTCFKGDKDAPKDTESASIWASLGIPKERIQFLGKKDNWWGPAGKTGPCGPDTEMFYWKAKKAPPKKFNPSDENWIEIWNDVLMQYTKTPQGFKEAKQKNIDTGMGVERTIATLNNLEDNYLTDLFLPIIKKIEQLSGRKYGKNERQTRHMRIIADHIKAATFLLADNILPSKTEQGYILRRLIRRAIRYGFTLGMKNFTKQIAEPIFKIYPDYKHLQKNKKSILEELEKAELNFAKTIEDGLKRAKKILEQKIPLDKKKNIELRNLDESMEIIMDKILEKKEKGQKYNIKEIKLTEKEIDQALINGKEAFLIYQSYGFPEEMLKELAVKERLLVDLTGFQKQLKQHQKLSRTATKGRFKSGLADQSEKTTKLHTAAHLLLAALRKTLQKETKEDIQQHGSNITPERLRFDFNFPRKLTQEELNRIEQTVNNQIKKAIPITKQELPLKQALKTAQSVPGAKYPDKVTVYEIEKFSKEICAGPHTENTNKLGKFKIIKEESSSAGIRRIKAILK